VTEPLDELPPGLREEYFRGTRDRLADLADLADLLTERGNDLEAVDRVRREAHKIRGSAGSYGFGEATRVAADLEEVAKSWLAHPGEHPERRGPATRMFIRRLAVALLAEAPQAGAGQPAPRPGAPPPASAAGPRDLAEVIVVEDDPALLELLEYGLRSRGYRYSVFRNGGEALKALLALEVRDTQPLLLLDVDLPALDGYSIFESLQRERPGVYRTVFTTVHGNEEEQLRGLEAGALDYLVKPISLRVALEKIRHWVGR
jgi:CheY-like chemotaxis protein